MNGGTIRTAVNDELTYDLLHSSERNLWSVLFMTGYLTKADPKETDSLVSLRIPNREVSRIFETTVTEWFRDTLDRTKQRELFAALWGGDEATATEILSDLLWKTISFHDYREDYYHGFLMGVFAGAGYAVDSNREYGLGRADVVVLDPDNRRALIIEAKKAESESAMGRECGEALRQMGASVSLCRAPPSFHLDSFRPVQLSRRHHVALSHRQHQDRQGKQAGFRRSELQRLVSGPY